MIQTNITHDQATKLAAFINAIRPDWDKPGVLDALAKARGLGNASEVAIAAIRCAGSAKARTPAVIAMDGEHWRPAPADPHAMGDRRVLVHGRCDDCGRLHPEVDGCIPPTEVTQAATHRGATEIRDLLAEAKARHCSHGVPAQHCADHDPARQPAPEETA